MTKKLLALFTVVCVLTTLIVIPSVVQAEYSNRWTDSFETGSGSVVYESGEEYHSSGENGLFIDQNTVNYGNLWSSHLDLTEDKGYKGTGSLYIHCDTSKNGEKYRETMILTRGVVLQADTALVLRYKVKFEDFSAVGTTDTGSVVYFSSVYGAQAYPNVSKASIYMGNNVLATNKWYTVVTKVTGTTETKSTTTYIFDENGSIATSGTRDIKIGITSGLTAKTQPVYLVPIYVPQVEGVTRLHVDDVSLTEVKTDSTESIAFDAYGSNITNGETGVAINKTLRLAFDHDLASAAADTVKLYKATDTQKTSPISCTVSAKAFDSFLLTPAELELNTEYVLDFSSVTSSAGAAISKTSQSISFKTVDPGETPIEPVKFVSAAATSGNFTDGAYSNTPLTDAFTLNFDSAILEPTYGTAVKLYKTADTSRTAVAATLTMADDAKSFTITPTSALSLGTNYTIDYAGVKTSLGGALEGTSEVTFTTIASRAPLYLKDNLEDAPVGSAGYYTASNIFDSFSSYVSIAEGVGIDGSNGIKINNTANSSASVNIRSKNFDLDESETLFIEFKIKISSVSATDTQAVYFTVSNASTLYPGANDTIFKILRYSDTNCPLTDRGQGKAYTYDTSEWYTMLMQIGRTSQAGYILDKDGNVVLEQAYTNLLGNSVKLGIGTVSANKTVAVIDMDNFKVSRVQNETLAPLNSECTVTNGATDIGTTGDIKLVFNQPFYKAIKADEVFSLYEESTKLDATIRRTGGNEIIITPAQSLNAGRTYTIKVASTLTSLSGKTYGGPAEIKFTTKKIYDINAISTTLAIAQDGSISSGSKTLVVDNVGEEVANPVVVAAIYADHRLSRIIGYEVFNVDTLTAGENTLTITLADSYTNAGSVKILVYDSMSNLEPLMKAYNVTK